MEQTSRALKVAKEPLWVPTKDQIENANATDYMHWLKEHDIFDAHQDWDILYRWSVDHPEDFWASLWDYFGVIGDKGERPYLSDHKLFLKRRFFPKGSLNYAENLLKKEFSGAALIFRCEDKKRKELSFQELRIQVARLQKYLYDECGVREGDRVAGYLHCGPESLIGFLACVSLGAIWSTCSPDFGAQGVLDRFKQIEPKVLLVIDGYYYKGHENDLAKKNKEVCANLPTVQHILKCSLIGTNDVGVETSGDFDQIISDPKYDQPLSFKRLPFDHPMVILFSSGTTGTPKCIVHGHGGTLLQHLKEHRLHSDVKPGDRVFYYTTTGWMMWNWLVAALGSGATAVMYDGSPFTPSPNALFDMIDAEKVSFFGVSAKYIDSLLKADVHPLKTHNLSSLRTIGSTGSPLVQEAFRYVYHSIKKDVDLTSLSGGTDIVSCFALGCPIKPVYAGELQSRGLGLAVEVFNDDGKPTLEEKGELVCTKPFPCMPVAFWNDPENKRYHSAYFENYGEVWRHGDFCMLTHQDGLIIFGRSDAVLNPGGVRIGTAEIYRQIDKIKEVEESIAVGQKWGDDDMRIILFVVMRPGIELTKELKDHIKKYIHDNASPRHAPTKIIAVPDIPRTRSGKIVELAVTHVIHGEHVKNVEALANPEALEHFKNLEELKS